MNKNSIVVIAVLLATSAFAAPTAASRDTFVKQQAYAEMQRVLGQIDVLQASHDELAERVSKMDGGKGDLNSLKADVASLRAEIDSVRREMSRMRQEIVADITKKVTAIVKANGGGTSTPVRTAPSLPAEGTKIYTVQAGDTLSLIAQAFSTSVSRIKEINNLRSDNLRVGQKLHVPKN